MLSNMKAVPPRCSHTNKAASSSFSVFRGAKKPPRKSRRSFGRQRYCGSTSVYPHSSFNAGATGKPILFGDSTCRLVGRTWPFSPSKALSVGDASLCWRRAKGYSFPSSPIFRKYTTSGGKLQDLTGRTKKNRCRFVNDV